MMMINIRTSMVFKEIFGNWKFQVSLPEESTFEDLIKELIRTYGERLRPYLFDQNGKTLASHLMFMVNGRNIRFLEKEKTILHNEDLVTILMPAGGG
jgi:molybdopterin converting factor small subunit